MLSDEEIQEIRNRAKLNSSRQIDPMAFARDIERAVLAKASPQVLDDAQAACDAYIESLGGADSNAWHDAPVDGVFIAGFEAGRRAMPAPDQYIDVEARVRDVQRMLKSTWPQSNFKKDGKHGLCSLERKAGGVDPLPHGDCPICGLTGSTGSQCPRVTVPTYNDTGKPVLQAPKPEGE